MWALCLIKKYLKILPRFRGKSSSACAFTLGHA